MRLPARSNRTANTKNRAKLRDERIRIPPRRRTTFSWTRLSIVLPPHVRKDCDATRRLFSTPIFARTQSKRDTANVQFGEFSTPAGHRIQPCAARLNGGFPRANVSFVQSAWTAVRRHHVVASFVSRR